MFFNSVTSRPTSCTTCNTTACRSAAHHWSLVFSGISRPLASMLLSYLTLLLAVPASARRADHLFDYSLRSGARCAHGPRSLRGPTASTAGLPRGNGSRFPVRFDCGGSCRKLGGFPSVSSADGAPESRYLLHPRCSNGLFGLPDPDRWSAWVP